MISFKDLQIAVANFNKLNSPKYNEYCETINSLRKQYSTYRRQPYNNLNFNKGSKQKARNNYRSTPKDSKLKSLLTNSDKMINSFTSSVNKLNERNYKIIYNEVVQLFTNYIGSFITDYVESYVKFGVSNKCEIEDLNLDAIKDKYIHYQFELWKILIDKYMNSRTTYMMYYKFINNLINWNTEVFNNTLIDNFKTVFKSYCGRSYDIIKLDGIDEEDPEQFFQPAVVELSERDTAIYNKITEIIELFQEYDFSLTKIAESNTYFLNTINNYISNVEILKIEPNDEFKKLIIKYIRRVEMGERLGLLWYYYLNNNASLNDIITVLDNMVLENSSYQGNNLSVIAYILMGVLNSSDILQKVLEIINKDNLKVKLENMSVKLPAQIRYKMMDIIDLL
jgi:hypothetical protein